MSVFSALPFFGESRFLEVWVHTVSEQLRERKEKFIHRCKVFVASRLHFV